MKPSFKTIWIVLFAIAMGYLESSVVVYLRELYYPEGFNFPLKAMSQSLAITELFREAATLVMILAVSILAAKLWLHRFAWFLVVFGIWDIAYYVFLKIILGWPESLLTTDILFLLPSMWTGPVIAPVINSITMILLAWAILAERKGVEPITRLLRSVWILLLVGSVITLIVYMEEFILYVIDKKQLFSSEGTEWNKFMITLSSQFIPRSFDWLLFSSGILMHFVAIFLIFTRKGIRPGN